MVKRTSKDDPVNLGKLLKTALHLIKQCRDTIAKRFVKMEILLFRNEIFLETKLANPQLTRSRRVKRN
jgi:hypothetical protein